MGANKFFFFPTQISLSLALSTNLKSKTNITSKYLSLFHVLFSSLALASQILLIMIEYHMHFLFLFLSFLNHTFPPLKLDFSFLHSVDLLPWDVWDLCLLFPALLEGISYYEALQNVKWKEAGLE